MNLDDVMASPIKNASLVNHDWWAEGLGAENFDVSPHYKDNNKKDDLEIAWGYGTIDTEYSTGNDAPAPAGVVDRNISDDEDDSKKVIMFARDAMNRGFMGKELVALIKGKFDKDSLKTASSELHELFKWNGIVGRVAIDARGYRSAKDALKATYRNPYKGCIKFIIKEKVASEDYAWLPSSKQSKFAGLETLQNSCDDFFANTDFDKEYTCNLVAHCKDTMIPILSGMSDLDESFMDDTLISLINITALPAQKAKSIQDDVSNGKYAAHTGIKKAFMWIEDKVQEKKSSKYAEIVDASEFIIGSSDQEIAFDAQVASEDLDLSYGNLNSENKLDFFDAPDSSSIDVNIHGSMSDLNITNSSASDILVNAHGNFEDIDISGEFVAADVRLYQHEDPMFINGDFDLNVSSKVSSEIDVELQNSIEF